MHPTPPAPRIAIVVDWLQDYAGAERVLEHNNAGLDLNVLQGLRDSATSAMRC